MNRVFVTREVPKVEFCFEFCADSRLLELSKLSSFDLDDIVLEYNCEDVTSEVSCEDASSEIGCEDVSSEVGWVVSCEDVCSEVGWAVSCEDVCSEVGSGVRKILESRLVDFDLREFSKSSKLAFGSSRDSDEVPISASPSLSLFCTLSV